jgi:hypothetical protein
MLKALLLPSVSRKGYPLLPRVLENGQALLDAYRAIARTIREERAITPAAEWLVDNFHIVDEQLREIRDDLPPGYYRELPKLAEDPFQGYPRVFGLAWAFVAHADSRFDLETLRRFVRAYQRMQSLTIGELWAIAITLRVAHAPWQRSRDTSCAVKTGSSFSSPHPSTMQSARIWTLVILRGVSSVRLDGTLLASNMPLLLADDNTTHHVSVVLSDATA